MSLKKAYELKMDALIKEWSTKIDVLKAKADRVGVEQQAKYHESLESLHQKRKKLETKLDELRCSSEIAWEEFKGGVDQAWEDLKSSVQRAGDQFK